MKLTDTAVEATTFEQLMHDVYAYDAQAQLRALNAPSDSAMNFSMTFTVVVPVALAREALDSFTGLRLCPPSPLEESLARAQRAFNQNPTPALSTIIKRLAGMVQRQRRKV